jgi:hypothetical protein
MLIKELIAEGLLTELTFGGSRCTKDCSGHKAGYRWALRKGKVSSNSPSPSFDAGSKIGAAQLKTGQVAMPKVRDERGKFSPHPKIR